MSLVRLVAISVFLTTLVASRVNSASIFESSEFDEEGESFNELESLKCLPSGFPCAPALPTTTATGRPEEEFSTSPTTSATEGSEAESTTTTIVPTTTNSPSKGTYRNFPSSCCTKCLYEPGWIDAVCA